MKVIRNIGAGLMFEAEATTQVELFRALADIDKSHEVFGEWKCGCCGSENICFNYRDVEYQDKDKQTGELLFHTSGKNKGDKKMTTSRYFEMRCRERDCYASKQFGQHKEGAGTMYPKNNFKDKQTGETVWLKNNGWKKFVKPTDDAPAKGGKKQPVASQDDDEGEGESEGKAEIPF